jgi:hypothetical protein
MGYAAPSHPTNNACLLMHGINWQSLAFVQGYLALMTPVARCISPLAVIQECIPVFIHLSPK